MDAATLEVYRTVQSLIGLLLIIVGFFIIRTLKAIDANHQKTAATLDALSKEFYTLKAEHKILAHRCHGENEE